MPILWLSNIAVLMRRLVMICVIFVFSLTPKGVEAKTVQIEYTEKDSYSIEVVFIDVGDAVEWLPVNNGHNVQFLAGPEMESLPRGSQIDRKHSVIFNIPGVYLYGCTPHYNMGMLGMIVVGGNIDNIEALEKLKLSRIAKSVVRRLVKNVYERDIY